MKTKRRPKTIAVVAWVLISWFLVPSLQAQTGFTDKDRQTLTALQVRMEETANPSLSALEAEMGVFFDHAHLTI